MAKKKTAKSATKNKPGASEIASRGGKARAEALTPEHRSKIGTNGARARWRNNPIKADFSGVLRLGSSEIPCANLPGGTRVISESAILSALGRSYSGYYSQRDAAAEAAGVAPVHRAVSPAVLREFVPAALAEMLAKPIAYKPPKGGSVSKGIPAEALAMILDVWINARNAGALTPTQVIVADKSEVLRAGFVNVGIAALIDEATGAQIHRAKNSLAEFLETFVTKELAAYGKVFQDEFYKEMFRLRGWDGSNIGNRPGIVGHWTTDIIYKRLAPGVLQRLQEIIPRDKSGRLKSKFHSALTADKGYIALKERLASVTTIMALSDSWEEFMSKLDKRHPSLDPQLIRDFLAKDAEEKRRELDE